MYIQFLVAVTVTGCCVWESSYCVEVLLFCTHLAIAIYVKMKTA